MSVMLQAIKYKMMIRKKMNKTPKISKERAIQIAMNLNYIPYEIAVKYTDSELRECLRLLKLKADF